jgi:hypothetical protein
VDTNEIFDGGGDFNVTLPYSAANPQGYFDAAILGTGRDPARLPDRAAAARLIFGLAPGGWRWRC